MAMFVSGSNSSTGSFGHVYAEKDIYMGSIGNIGGTANVTTHSIGIGSTQRYWGMTARRDPDVLSIGEIPSSMAMHFDNSGKVGIGITAPTNPLEIAIGAADESLKLSCFSTTNGHAPALMLYKSSNATIGTRTAVANGEMLGQIIGQVVKLLVLNMIIGGKHLRI